MTSTPVIFYRGVPPGGLGSSYYFIHVYSEYYQVDIFLLDIKGLPTMIHVEYCTCRLKIKGSWSYSFRQIFETLVNNIQLVIINFNNIININNVLCVFNSVVMKGAHSRPGGKC